MFDEEMGAVFPELQALIRRVICPMLPLYDLPNFPRGEGMRSEAAGQAKISAGCVMSSLAARSKTALDMLPVYDRPACLHRQIFRQTAVLSHQSRPGPGISQLGQTLWLRQIARWYLILLDRTWLM